MNLFRQFLFSFYVIFSGISYGQVRPLPGAHAHNDYNNDRPLLDALAYGFTSIEVDVLLIDDEIYVGHDLPESTHSLPTLVELYLQPLDSIINENGGQLYPGYNQACYLMIDIKTDAEKTYGLIREQLRPYKSWIGQDDNPVKKNKIIIFLSGNRPVQMVIMDPQRLVSLDGRPEDLGKGFDAKIMPVISQNYYFYSKWKGEGEVEGEGEGEMPLSEQENIRILAEKVHQEGKKLRLWGHPDNLKVWETLQYLGVDMINSDDLKGLRNYFLAK